MSAVLIWAAMDLVLLSDGLALRCPDDDGCGCCAKGVCTCDDCGCCYCKGACEGCCDLVN